MGESYPVHNAFIQYQPLYTTRQILLYHDLIQSQYTKQEPEVQGIPATGHSAREYAGA